MSILYDWSYGNCIDAYIVAGDRQSENMWVGTTTFLTSTSSGSSSVRSSTEVERPIVGEEELVSSRPWNGERPPTSFYVGSSLFIQRD
ncbi:MAG: hypothetical protein ACKPKO_40205, partial [Candidatus Fonsibacter sp.]